MSFLQTKITNTQNWFQHHSRDDVVAGISTGILLIPQAMAYAILVGVEPIYGLYAALFPPILYFFWGKSPFVSLGPVAIESMLVGKALITFSPDERIQLAGLLALMIGFFQCILSFFPLQFIKKLFTPPIILGFTNGAALLIFASQLSAWFKIKIPGNLLFFEKLNLLFQERQNLHFETFTFGFFAIVFLFTFQKIAKTFPRYLVLIIISVLCSYYYSFSNMGIEILGALPLGLPAFSAPLMNTETLIQLLPTTILVSLVACSTTFALNYSLSDSDEIDINPAKEFRTLGLSNIVVSFFSAFPISSGVSRSFFNKEAGAKTQTAALISSMLVALTLVFLAPLFYYLPKVVLSAIIIATVLNMLSLRTLWLRYFDNKTYFIIALVTFISILFLGIFKGLILGFIVQIYYQQFIVS